MSHLKVQRNMPIDAPSVEGDAFRTAMRQLAGGVSIVAAGQGSDRCGMTVTSLASFSLVPPTLIVSVSRQSSVRPLLDRYKAFGASILNAGHSAVANRFAGHGGLKRQQPLHRREVDNVGDRRAAARRRSCGLRL